MYDILELNSKLLPELKEIAKNLGVHKVESFRKKDLIYKILDLQAIKASSEEAAKPQQKKTRPRTKSKAKKVAFSTGESTQTNLFSAEEENGATTGEDKNKIATPEKKVNIKSAEKAKQDNQFKKENGKKFLSDLKKEKSRPVATEQVEKSPTKLVEATKASPTEEKAVENQVNQNSTQEKKLLIRKTNAGEKDDQKPVSNNEDQKHSAASDTENKSEKTGNNQGTNNIESEPVKIERSQNQKEKIYMISLASLQ